MRTFIRKPNNQRNILPRRRNSINDNNINNINNINNGDTSATTAGDSDKNNKKDDNNNNVFDVCICGAGPAGLLLASNLAQLGCSVHIIDPTLTKPWPNNYGIWMDEAAYFGYENCMDHIWTEVGVIYDEKTPEQILHRPYGRVDRKALKQRLVQECTDAMGNVKFTEARAVKLEHYDDKPSTVTIQTRTHSTERNNDNAAAAAATDSTETCRDIVEALLVVDATGFSRQFVQHDRKFDPGYQVTYGARFRVKDLGPYQLHRMVLMDYSEGHLTDDIHLLNSNHRFPSFVYAMPLAQNELFLEETILVSRPAGNSQNLQSRLQKRMKKALNITAIDILEDERAAIPMGGADPIVPQRTIGFGATSSLVHPASGYMVARAMEVAPRVARSMIPHVQSLRFNYQSKSLTKSVFDDAAADVWEAIWPSDERRQRDFMHFGFELLCKLNPQELRDFFTGFFRLPYGLWEHFLSWRLSGIGHIVMGLTVWASCIPRRFMPSMLIKSLPFLGNTLMMPFVKRGWPLFMESIYWDARSPHNSTLWEPHSYYPYVDQLAKKTTTTTMTMNNNNKKNNEEKEEERMDKMEIMTKNDTTTAKSSSSSYSDMATVQKQEEDAVTRP